MMREYGGITYEERMRIAEVLERMYCVQIRDLCFDNRIPIFGRHPTFDEADFWDADEDYKFDFQLLKCRNSFARVYSLAAWKFLQEFSPFETDLEFCFCVIRPKAKT